MTKILFALVSLALSAGAFAQIREFQTTRLNSSAGTGVASILSTEAAILNPATSAFFKDSSASYQSYSARLKDESEVRDLPGMDFPDSNRSQGIFISDNSSEVKGGAAYINQDENNYERQKFVVHGAAPMGANAAMGISYNYVQDKMPRSFKNRHRVHHQLVLGSIVILDDKTSIGVVVVDPTRTTPGEERLLAGFQYSIADRFTVLADGGAQYSKNFQKENLWRAALQVNIFGDFFIRAGKFYDNIVKLEGTGWGASWMGPRLGVEFAQKFSEQFGEDRYLYKNETIVDTSLSAVIKF